MYKNLLVPTDGTKLSDKALRAAVGLAQAVGGRITLFHAVPEYQHAIYMESAVLADSVPPETFNAEAVNWANKMLAREARKVDAAGVKVTTDCAVGNTTHEAIIAAATKHKCGLVVMASHGRSGVSGFLLGSETQKVLTHSKIPVLVVR
jgi:nucleotide-binding universal stress UspA family protein